MSVVEEYADNKVSSCVPAVWPIEFSMKII